MSNRSLQLALHITLLKEEFSEKEILEAVKILEAHGSPSTLLNYLAGRRNETKSTKKAKSKSKPFAEQRSRAVVELEHKDPEKFQVLSEFDALLRKASVLPEVEDIKRVGERISKSFAPKNSRRESISQLMVLLADRSLEEIREIVQASLSNAQIDKSDNDYQQLAQFIITGKTHLHKGEQRA